MKQITISESTRLDKQIDNVKAWINIPLGNKLICLGTKSFKEAVAIATLLEDHIVMVRDTIV